MTNWELYRAAQIKKAKKEAETKGTSLVELINRTITEYHDESLTYVGQHAFRRCLDLGRVTLPNALMADNYAFAECSALTDVCFPMMTNIGYASFSSCRSLPIAEFPNAVSINALAFGNCSALETLILSGESVVRLLNTSAFTGSLIEAGTGFVYVPDTLVSSYKSADNWSTYAAQIKPLSELSGGA